MDLLTPSFLERLHLLRDRLSGVLRKFEFFRTTPTGHLVTPETESHRPYVSGDDPRYVDWNIYARLERFFVRTVLREEEGVVHLFLDSSASMRIPHPSKYRLCLETAAGIGYMALMAGNQVAAHSWSDRLLLSRSWNQGEKDTHDFLNQLGSLPSGSETDLGRSLEQLRRLGQESSSRLLIFSDFLERGPYWDQLNLMNKQGSRLAAIQVLHEREVSPRVRGYLRISDPESDRSMQRVAGHRLQKEYRRTIKQFLGDLEDRFREQRIPFLRSSSHTPFEDVVMDFFTHPSWNSSR